MPCQRGQLARAIDHQLPADRRAQPIGAGHLRQGRRLRRCAVDRWSDVEVQVRQRMVVDQLHIAGRAILHQHLPQVDRHAFVDLGEAHVGRRCGRADRQQLQIAAVGAQAKRGRARRQRAARDRRRVSFGVDPATVLQPARRSARRSKFGDSAAGLSQSRSWRSGEQGQRNQHPNQQPAYKARRSTRARHTTPSISHAHVLTHCHLRAAIPERHSNNSMVVYLYQQQGDGDIVYSMLCTH